MPKNCKMCHKGFFLEIFKNSINILKQNRALEHLYMAVSQWSKYMSTMNLLNKRFRETKMYCLNWWISSMDRFEAMYSVLRYQKT